MDGPDALLALADAVNGDDQIGKQGFGQVPPAAVEAPAEEQEDLLLCLANDLAPAHHQQGSQQPPLHNKQSSSEPAQAAGKGWVQQHPAKKYTAETHHPRSPPAAAAAASIPTPTDRGPGHMLQHRRPSFSTQGQQQQQQQQPQQAAKKQSYECQHYVEKLTGLKIKLPRVSGIVLKERYRHTRYVPVGEAKGFCPSDGQTAAWVVIAVLVGKSIGSTSQGAPYSRWRIADLAGNDAWVALFGEAHKEHYSEAEGSVIALYQPRFTSKASGGGSSSSSGGLAVSQSSQVELLATSSGWGFCRGKTKTGTRCQSAVDTTVSHYCQYHALQHAKVLKAGVPRAAAAAVGSQTGQRTAAAAAAALTGTPAVPAQSNGMVFDARKGTWSSLSSSKVAQQGSSSSKLPAGAGSQLMSSSSSCSSSRCALLPVGVPLGDAAAAAAVAKVEARIAAERQRRHAALQAEVKLEKDL